MYYDAIDVIHGCPSRLVPPVSQGGMVLGPGAREAREAPAVDLNRSTQWWQMRGPDENIGEKPSILQKTTDFSCSNKVNYDQLRVKVILSMIQYGRLMVY